jgi:hypothetical protein
VARRKNASFTGSPLYGGPRELVDEFYSSVNREIPGSTPVPIPPPESVHLKHDLNAQAFIFADYAVRKIAPIVVGVLRELPEIVDEDTASRGAYNAKAVIGQFAPAPAYVTRVVTSAVRTATYAADAVDDDKAAARTAARSAARNAAKTACEAAKIDPDATWAAVNEMLQAL